MTPVPSSHRPLFFAIAAGLLCAAGLRAATYLPLSDRDLVRRSPVVARARAIAQEQALETLDGVETVMTRTTFLVLETLKGEVGSPLLRVALPGGTLGEVSTWIAGTPAFVIDGEFLLLLSPPSAPDGDYGLTEFALSAFDILEDRLGRRFAARAVFEPGVDDFLSKRSAEILAAGASATRLRDADALAAAIPSLAAGNDPEIPYAEPEGELRRPGAGARPMWVNIGGTEGTSSLYRWFWDTGLSSAALVSASGTQSGLSDGSNGLSSVANAVTQWSSVAGATVRYSQTSGSAPVVVNLDVESKSPYWSTALSCTSGGVIGLGGPGSVSAAGSFKGDSGYDAIRNANVWMRKVTGGCYSAATFRTAVLHELGHTLGLGHSDQSTSAHSTTTSADWASAVMVSSVPPSRPSTPQTDDIEAVLWYYGSGSGSVSAPRADFTVSANPVTAGQAVQFMDSSAGSPSAWAWTFGDGSVSSSRNPTHVYASAATFVVSLTVTNSAGSNTKTVSLTVLSGGTPPVAGFSFAPAGPVAGQAVQFTDTSAGGPATWAWSFGDPAAGFANFSSLPNPVHAFSAPGTYAVTLTVFNANGSTSVTRPVTVSGCSPSATALCLTNGRFRVEVFWQAPALGMSGAGQASPLTADTGYFWFFSPNNVELIVKVLDGRAVNGSFWVFYGALSDVQYTITVTDTVTGTVKSYFNPQGRLASAADTLAFSEAPDIGARVTKPSGSDSGTRDRGSSTLSSPSAPCSADPGSLCVNRSRFRVQVSWSVPAQSTSGQATAVPMTSDTGYFWFFSPSTPELFVKVVDGTAVNGRFWVFSGALSNVQYSISVTDTLTGTVRIYENPNGNLMSMADTSAF